MSIENRSAYENITTDPENILQMHPVSCDFGRFANAGECKAEVIEKPVPSYTISSNKTSVNEGESITFTIVGVNTIAGVNIPYTITGISASDLSSGSLTGNFILNSSFTGTITLTLRNDTLTEGLETLKFSIAGSFIDVTVNDTSLSPIVTPTATYVVTADKTSINEGESVTFSIVATNAVAGASVPYTITGISAADLLTGSLTGNFVLDSNLQNSITVSLKNDTLTEGSETMRLAVTGSFVNVLVNDTSLSPTYYVYYGNGLENYTSESQVTQFTSKATTNKNGSYSFPEGAETDDVVYKWIFIQTNLGAVTDLNSFKVGTFSANMKSVGTIGNFYAYRTNNMSFGAVTITLG